MLAVFGGVCRDAPQAACSLERDSHDLVEPKLVLRSDFRVQPHAKDNDDHESVPLVVREAYFTSGSRVFGLGEPHRQEIDKRADLRRHVASVCVDCIDWARVGNRLVTAEHHFELLASKLDPEIPVR